MNQDNTNPMERKPVSRAVTSDADLLNAPVAWPGVAPAILLVEDMATLRNMTRDFLLLLGYEVITAEDGREAVEILRSRSEIELIVTDVNMPVMGGLELAAHGRRLNSDVKVIFSSGFGEVDVQSVGLSEENTLVLHKPYSLSTLASRVREMLSIEKEKKTA